MDGQSVSGPERDGERDGMVCPSILERVDGLCLEQTLQMRWEGKKRARMEGFPLTPILHT